MGLKRARLGFHWCACRRRRRSSESEETGTHHATKGREPCPIGMKPFGDWSRATIMLVLVACSGGPPHPIAPPGDGTPEDKVATLAFRSTSVMIEVGNCTQVQLD